MNPIKSNWSINESGRITTAPMQPVTIERPEFASERIRVVEELPLGQAKQAVTFLDRLQQLWFISKLTVRITPHIVKLIVGLKMKNWKTTLGAIIAGLSSILGVLGIVDIPSEIQTALIALGVFIVGLFAGDAKKDDAGNN